MGFYRRMQGGTLSLFPCMGQFLYTQVAIPVDRKNVKKGIYEMNPGIFFNGQVVRVLEDGVSNYDEFLLID